MAPRDTFDVPDRRTGRKGVDELRRRWPNREWRFVEVDVAKEEMAKWEGRVKALVWPLETVMDLTRTPYHSTARVVLSGLGADEQLGGKIPKVNLSDPVNFLGYSRHRKRFESDGWEGLLDELQLDTGRIAGRNLGRDDRIVGDHGKELRFPYLSTTVINFLSSLPVHHKVDPRLPRGIGDKLLLRQMAASVDGWMPGVEGVSLSRASVECKRAVQFGARTAKMGNGGERGGDVLE
ncbi:Asparagine synthetase domain-containing protein 1 [Phlyctochytrium planicorne]|nr:Asparagine synthetase domain-containing protein 1 [Phlyctochytrium planicorne]